VVLEFKSDPKESNVNDELEKLQTLVNSRFCRSNFEADLILNNVNLLERFVHRGECPSGSFSFPKE